MRNQTPSLLAQAKDQANQEHNRRIAELTALAPALEKLDAYVPQLEAQGLRFYTHNLSLRREALAEGARTHRRVVRLHTDGYSLADKAASTAKWFKALNGLGFATVSTEPGLYPTALLRKGALLLRIDAHESWLDSTPSQPKPAEPAGAAA